MNLKLKFFFYCLLFAGVIANIAMALDNWDQGYVLLVDRSFVYIDMGKNYDLKEGDICYAYESIEHHLSPVARLEVLESYENSAVTRIAETNTGKMVRFADLVSVQEVVQTRDGLSILNQDLPDLAGSSDYDQPYRRQSNPFAWTALSVGGALSIAAYYSNHRADSTYKMFKQALVKTKANEFKSKTQQLDRQTGLLLGASVLSLTTSAVLFLIQDQDTDSVVQTSFLTTRNGIFGKIRFRW